MNDKKIFTKSKHVYEENIKLFPTTWLNFPNENLIRLFSGKYVTVPQPPTRVMDHGFGHGNNLAFFASKGYECAGCEISELLIDKTQELFKSIGKTADLRPIKGLEIPFDDENFDIIVSWSAIYFNGTREAVLKVIGELRRVLKPGGVLLLSTIHPDSALFSHCRHLGNGSYLVESGGKYSNLDGLTYFFPQSAEELASMFGEFREVKTGSYSFDLFNPIYG